MCFSNQIVSQKFTLHTSWDSSASKETDCRLDDWGSVSHKCRNFSLCHHKPTTSGAHQAFYQEGTGCSFVRCKAIQTHSWPLTSIKRWG